MCCYRGNNSLPESSCTDSCSDLLLEFSDIVLRELCVLSKVIVRVTNGGWVGTGRVEGWLLIITRTADIVGRSAASSWIHNMPMWIHLIISIPELADNDSSTILIGVPSLQFLHTYKMWKTQWINRELVELWGRILLYLSEFMHSWCKTENSLNFIWLWCISNRLNFSGPIPTAFQVQVCVNVIQTWNDPTDHVN